MQGLTKEESLAISNFSRDSTSIFSRRIQTGVFLLQDIVPGIGSHIASEMLADDEHAYLAVFPKHEKSTLVARREKFGTSFPGLYSLDKKPLNKDGITGGVDVPRSENPIVIMGDPNGKSVLVTACAFDLKRDVRFTICNLGVQSARDAKLRFKYRVYLLFIITYGEKIQPFNTSDVLEDQVVRFFRENIRNESLA